MFMTDKFSLNLMVVLRFEVHLTKAWQFQQRRDQILVESVTLFSQKMNFVVTTKLIILIFLKKLQRWDFREMVEGFQNFFLVEKEDISFNEPLPICLAYWTNSKPYLLDTSTKTLMCIFSSILNCNYSFLQFSL